MNRKTFVVLLCFSLFVIVYQLTIYVKIPAWNEMYKKRIKDSEIVQHEIYGNERKMIGEGEMEKDQENCVELIKSNLNIIVTESILYKLIIVCKLNEMSKFGKAVYTFVNNLQCNPSVTFATIEKPLIALASFPGSGNTMTRRILEILTGIQTAYYHRIVKCRSKHFRNIVKTHGMHFGPGDKSCRGQNYSRAIYIIRNPFKTIYAEYNRRYAAQIISEPNATYFGKRWRGFVWFQIERWRSMTVFWLKTFKHPVHILVYENITEYRLSEVFRLSTFLHVNSTIKMLLCTFSQYVEKKKRTLPGPLLHKYLYDIYDSNLVRLVNNVILQTHKIVNLSVLLDYMLPSR